MRKDLIKLLVTGDFCPVNRIEKLALNSNFDDIFNDFNNVLADNDLVITDLECPLTITDETRRKIGPHQKARPECVKILDYADIGLVTLANNHIMDYGSKGVEDTLEICKAKNISFVGIGTSIKEASEPYFLKKKNKRIAILNFADDEFIITPDGKYRCNAINTLSFYYDIQRIRQSNDFILVIVHGGNEFYEFPSPRIKKLYRFLIDVGADVVLAHHTHVFSGYELYKSKPIFYGLGNFLYDWPGKCNTAWNRGYAVRLLLSENIDFELIPFKQGNEMPGVFLLNERETADFEKQIQYLNSVIADDTELEQHFSKYVKSVSPMYDAFIEPYFGKFISSLRNQKLFPRLMSSRKRLLLLNIVRCESHREVLMRILGESWKDDNL